MERCPLCRARLPQGRGQTQPLLLTDASCTLPTCAHVSLRSEGGGERAPRHSRGRGVDPLGVPALLEGSWEVGKDLKTTRINRFVYQEQARVFHQLNRTEKILKTSKKNPIKTPDVAGRGDRPTEHTPPGRRSATITVINNYYYFNDSISPFINKLGITTSQQNLKKQREHRGSFKLANWMK